MLRVNCANSAKIEHFAGHRILSTCSLCNTYGAHAEYCDTAVLLFCVLKLLLRRVKTCMMVTRRKSWSVMFLPHVLM